MKDDVVVGRRQIGNDSPFGITGFVEDQFPRNMNCQEHKSLTLSIGRESNFLHVEIARIAKEGTSGGPIIDVLESELTAQFTNAHIGEIKSSGEVVWEGSKLGSSEGIEQVGPIRVVAFQLDNPGFSEGGFGVLQAIDGALG